MSNNNNDTFALVWRTLLTVLIVGIVILVFIANGTIGIGVLAVAFLWLRQIWDF
jgi:hypothetical protein